MSERTSDNLTVLTVSIGRHRLAVPSAHVREILDPLPCTRVPGAGSVAPWVMNVRGAVVPLADLRGPLGIRETDGEGQDLPADDRRRFVVLEVEIGGERAVVAIVADAVHDVTTIPRGRIEPLPPASQLPKDFLQGIVRGDDRFVLIPDLSSVFTHLAQRAAAAA